MIDGGPLGAAEFCKYHALGNDYLVIDGERFGSGITPETMAALCHRHTGIGSDGVLVLGPGQKDDGSDAAVRIFNPDGSEAEKSGNGLRIAGRALYDLGYVDGPELRVRLNHETVAMTLMWQKSRAQSRPQVASICAAMGKPRIDSASVAMLGPPRATLCEPLNVLGQTFAVTALSMGNPHCVLFEPSPDVHMLRTLGPAIERHPIFTQRTNVQLAHVLSPSHIALLIWERGAGETSASGSSSCAAVAAAQARGLCLLEGNITVTSPGGVLTVRREADGTLMLTGPAAPICRGTYVVTKP